MHQQNNVLFDFKINSNPIFTEPNKEDPKCFKLNIIAIACTVLFIAGTIINGTLLFTFLRFKTLQTRGNIFVIALTILNLFGTVFELPWIIISNFYCRLVNLKLKKIINRISTKFFAF
jgi:hypothetical protein